MISEPFAVGTSLVHRMDPRFKVVTAVLYCSTVALIHRLPALGAALMVSMVLAVVARLAWRLLLRRLAALVGFMAMLWVLLPLTVTGGAGTALGPFVLNHAGMLLAAEISLKSIAIMVAFTALVATMPMASLGRALGLLHVPDKLVYLLLMTYRYVFVLEQEYHRLVRAVKIRGFQPGTNLHAYKTYAYLVGMLFVRASERARRVHHAMICRGFRGQFYSLADFPASPVNWVFLVVMTGLVAGLALWSWFPAG